MCTCKDTHKSPFVFNQLDSSIIASEGLEESDPVIYMQGSVYESASSV